MSSSASLIESGAVSAEACASASSRKHVTVTHSLSPAAIAWYEQNPGCWLIFSANPVSTRCISSSIAPGATLYLRTLAYMSALLTLGSGRLSHLGRGRSSACQRALTDSTGGGPPRG